MSEEKSSRESEAILSDLPAEELEKQAADEVKGGGILATPPSPIRPIFTPPNPVVPPDPVRQL